ncbi:hypothetical protein HPP92_010662 [Vanilla planifolia]|uniref:Uncharacterized protein n=1 Tax=Vanilla planifolia TaxID=51239 RepID=A0A835R2T7_VANPL|nr:hypothetical protein HPP92_010662 [Vanilla planifolia]
MALMMISYLQIHLVDLAGSEHAKRTGADGLRFKGRAEMKRFSRWILQYSGNIMEKKLLELEQEKSLYGFELKKKQEAQSQLLRQSKRVMMQQNDYRKKFNA